MMLAISFSEALLSSVVYFAAAVIFYRTSADNVPQREKLCRSRIAGLLLTLPAVFQCVPLAVPVSPGFLVPWLWPLAVILPVLCFFYIDFYAARALGLWLIVAAYGMIHTAFEQHVPGTPLLAVVNWFAGIAGMWISAKPYLLRDWLRKAAEKRCFRYGCTVFAAILAICALYTAIMSVIF